MKTRNALLIITLASTTLFSCRKDGWPCVKGSGDVSSEIRTTEDFESIDLDIAGDLYLTQDSTIKNPVVVVETHDNIQDRVQTRVKNNTLIIDDKGACIKNYKTLNVFITVPDLEEVTINGSGSINSENSFKVDQLKFAINGSGDIDFDLTSKEAIIKISGSGSATLDGSTKEFEVDLTGSGDIFGYGFQSEECFIDISGSGSVEAYATTFLDINISGSGDVNYDGPVTDVNTNISGSGSINRR